MVFLTLLFFGKKLNVYTLKIASSWTMDSEFKYKNNIQLLDNEKTLNINRYMDAIASDSIGVVKMSLVIRMLEGNQAYWQTVSWNNHKFLVLASSSLRNDRSSTSLVHSCT